jgi:protein-tyrosine phosphatase
MMEKLFPDWANRIEYWQVNDIDFTNPKEALPELKRLVENMTA